MSAPGAQLKICGITHPDDLDACLAHGVPALGLNLWPGSKRALTFEQAAPLVRRARAGSGPAPTVVAVMVDPTEAEVHRAFDELAVDLVQPHGDAPIERYARLHRPYAWVIRGTPELATLQVPSPAPAWILLDARVEGFGGQGVTTDWSWAARAVRALRPVPVWLAGGITPDNAASALAEVQPAGLDVASGAERPGDPRRKDPAAIAALASICQNPTAP